MSRMLRRFKNDGDGSLKEMVESKDPAIVYEVVNSIIYGIEHKLDRVECFEIENASKVIVFKMDRSEWQGCLEKCLPNMISYEDYEICQVMKEQIKLLADEKL